MQHWLGHGEQHFRRNLSGSWSQKIPFHTEVLLKSKGKEGWKNAVTLP